MAKQRSSFEKRQRERAKRERRERKAQRKAQRKAESENGVGETIIDEETGEEIEVVKAEGDVEAEGEPGDESGGEGGRAVVEGRGSEDKEGEVTEVRQ